MGSMASADSIAPAVVAALTWLLLLLLLCLVQFLLHLPRTPRGINAQVLSEPKVHTMDDPRTYPFEFEGPSLLDLSLDQIGVPTLQPESHLVQNRTAINNTGGASYRIQLRSPLEMSTSPTMPMKSQANAMEEPASFSNEPRWAMGSSVFDDLEQELKAARNEKIVLSRTPALRTSFFQHGLRYIPGRHDDEIYRSIVVENLPPHANLGQILLGIRGGPIYSATLCDTNVLTGTQTALVTFVRQEGALAFLQRVAQDDFYIGFHQAWVCPVLTPTYPLAPEMDIYVKNGRTRCLAVNRVRPGVVQTIYRILSKSPCHLYVEYFGENPSAGNEIRVHFHSIKMAMRAREILAAHASLEGCGIIFAPDPCAM